MIELTGTHRPSGRLAHGSADHPLDHPTEQIPVGSWRAADAAGGDPAGAEVTQVIRTAGAAESTDVLPRPGDRVDPSIGSDEVPGDGSPTDLDAPPRAPGTGLLDRWGRRRVALIAAGGVLLALVAVYLVDLVATSGEIERNTTIAGVPVGGMTPEQALAALQRQAVPGFAGELTLDAHGQPVALDPVAAGLTPDAAGSVQAAGTRSANPFTRFSSFFRSTELPLGVQVDRAALEDFATATATATDVAPVEGDVRVEGTEVVTVDPITGKSLQVPQTVDAVAAAWVAGGPGAVAGLSLPTTDGPVRATPAATEAAAAETTTILASPLVLDANGSPVEIGLAAIAAATTVVPDDADGFTVSVDVAALRAPVTGPVEATQTTPANATIAIVNGAPAITPSVAGRVVDWPATDAGLEPALRSANHTLPVVYVVSEPELTTEKSQALGITEVIGEFTTGGFEYASGENIRVVAERVNGAIVQPRTTFALNEFTGPRGVEQGYISSGIIQDGRPARAVGGGISQFATTMYNAAYFAGMGDVTHTPHSFYISRYPAGREATVFDGQIELAFSNDYDTGVLIETIWTEEDITIRLWGTKTVEVESITSDEFDYTSPQQIVVPFGESCSPSGGSSGYSVVNTRVIRDLAGAEIRREDFTTVYNGQQNVVCQPAPTAPAATPASAAPGAATTAPAEPEG